MKTHANVGLCLGALLLLTACASHTQTSSGARYLERHETAAARAGGAPLDAAVRAAADVEPLLEFPARVGIARIDESGLMPIPEAEVAAWRETANNLGPDWGRFVPISPLVVALVSRPITDNGQGYHDRLARLVNDIRLAGARQHLDAVLVYEVTGKSEVDTNLLGITKLSLIGIWIAPTEYVKADGFAQALLLDVRKGYTYGFTSVVAEDAVTGHATDANAWPAENRARQGAKTVVVVEKLAAAVEAMARKLRQELAEKRAVKSGG